MLSDTQAVAGGAEDEEEQRKTRVEDGKGSIQPIPHCELAKVSEMKTAASAITPLQSEGLSDLLTEVVPGDRAQNSRSHEEVLHGKQQSQTINLNEFVEQRSTSNKGYGIFAKKRIARGTLLIAEAPLIRIYTQFYFKADVQQAFDKLCEQRKEKYWKLASAHGQDASRLVHFHDAYLEYICPSNAGRNQERRSTLSQVGQLLEMRKELHVTHNLGNRYPSQISLNISDAERKRIREQHEARVSAEKSVLSIFQTNAMECGHGAAVFETAARFNHSCVPNAHFAWCEYSGMETIHAVRELAPDEEITLSYCDPLYDNSMREWELKHYGFDCTCPACVGADIVGSFADKSKERRWDLRDLVDADLSQATVQKKLQTALKIVALTHEEGLITPNLAGTYLDIARLASDQNDHEFAIKAAEKALDVYLTCLGKHAERTKSAVKSVRAFRKNLDSSKPKK